MTLLEALNAAKNGKTVTSSIGREYTPFMLGIEWCGEHYASCCSCGMTEGERKGNWQVTQDN